MKRTVLLVTPALLLVGMAGPAAAQPNPNERAVKSATQGCASVVANNPNTDPQTAPNAGTPGAENFIRVGEAFDCVAP